MLVRLGFTSDSAHKARGAVAVAVAELGRPDLVDNATLVVSELVANAVLHARTEMTLAVTAVDGGIRISVADGSQALPLWTPRSRTSTSGRGLLLVTRLSSRWGADVLPAGGKVVWAEIEHASVLEDALSPEDLLASWNDEALPVQPPNRATVEVRLTIDVEQMLSSRAHTDDLVRELQLTLLNAASRVTARATPVEIVRLARRLDSATEEFEGGRRQILTQTLSAAKRGEDAASLHLHLHPRDAAAARRWIDALVEADALTTAGVLLLPAFPPDMTAFRQRYIAAIVEQLETASAPHQTAS